MAGRKILLPGKKPMAEKKIPIQRERFPAKPGYPTKKEYMSQLSGIIADLQKILKAGRFPTGGWQGKGRALTASHRDIAIEKIKICKLLKNIGGHKITVSELV